MSKLALPGCLLVFAAAVCGQTTEPPGIHQLELQAHPIDASAGGIAAAPLSAEAGALAAAGSTPTVRPCKTIFGYLPYWENSASLRYDILTHIACFSVGANADGSITNSINWPNSYNNAKWSTVISTGHANGVRIILVVTCMDPDVLYALLTTNSARTALFANIKAQVEAGNADGVNIDFEASSNTPNWRQYINGFMSDLTTYMHAQIPGSEVSFAGPAVNWGGWNLPGLASSCDYVFIMGYDFYGSWSSTSGPSAPLSGGSHNITNTVNTQYAGISGSKLILGVPYYGNHWTTSTSAAYSTKQSYVGSVRFRDELSATYGRLWDSTSQTPWYRYQSGGVWHQVWYDDAESLAKKYDLADSKGYRGVGMWALNYDGSRSELWNLFSTRYAGCYAPVPDMDNDSDVDQSDFGLFQRCLGAADVVQRDSACQRARIDRDLDVDSGDAAKFVDCMSGPTVAPNTNCTH